MAKLTCKLVNIYAPVREKEKLLNRLQELSVMDIETAAQDEQIAQSPNGFSKTETDEAVRLYERQTGDAEEALKILNTRFPEKKGLLASFEGPPAIGKSEFYLDDKRAGETKQLVARVLENERMIAEQKAEIVRLQTSAEQLKPFEALDLPLSFEGTAQTAAFIGSVAGVYTLESLLSALAQKAPDLAFHAEILSTTQDTTFVFLCCSASLRAEAAEALRTLSFTRPVQTSSKLPSVKIAEKMERVKACEQKIVNCLSEIEEISKSRHDIEIFADFCRTRAETVRALGQIDCTDHTVLIRGYVVENDVEALQKALEKEFTVVLEVCEADARRAPVKLKNNAFASPAEALVEMYSLPSHEDIDPTPITGFFYYLFFGMMFSDAGYGLLMILATGFALLKLRLSQGMRKSCKLFLYCGISTFLWGLLYGSFFGDSIAVFSEAFFGRRVALPALIDPMNGDAVTMLILSIALGLLQVLVALCAKFATALKNGDRAGAFFDAGLWITTWVGIVIAVLGFTLAPFLKKIGIGVVIASVVGLILTQGRDKKNPVMRLFSGIASLYDITGYVSDLLSFSRLMALGLTTSAMSAVFNMLSAMGGKTLGGFVLLIIVFPLGHAINFALNVLGAYVHTLRLQYVELFSRFYEGGGKKFKPFSVKSKYVDLDTTTIKEESSL